MRGRTFISGFLAGAAVAFLLAGRPAPAASPDVTPAMRQLVELSLAQDLRTEEAALPAEVVRPTSVKAAADKAPLLAKGIAADSSSDEACRADSMSPDFCLNAHAGYTACRADGRDPAFCLGAQAGYFSCRAEGQGADFCLHAREGYSRCRADAQNPDFCVKAKAGYQACRAEEHSAGFCAGARGGYSACRADGFEPAFCLGAKDGYGACRADLQDAEFCLDAEKGYRSAGPKASRRNSASTLSSVD